MIAGERRVTHTLPLAHPHAKQVESYAETRKRGEKYRVQKAPIEIYASSNSLAAYFNGLFSVIYFAVLRTLRRQVRGTHVLPILGN